MKGAHSMDDERIFVASLDANVDADAEAWLSMIRPQIPPAMRVNYGYPDPQQS